MLLQYFDKTATATEPDDVYAALQKALPHRSPCWTSPAAEDKDAVVVTKETAAKYKLNSIADLARRLRASSRSAGRRSSRPAPTACPGLKKNYDCTFKDVQGPRRRWPAAPSKALKNGQVQAADIFTTDPSIAANNFVVAGGPEEQLRRAERRAADQQGEGERHGQDRSTPISAKLTTEELTNLNAEASSDTKPSPETVAKNWLSKNNLT